MQPPMMPMPPVMPMMPGAVPVVPPMNMPSQMPLQPPMGMPLQMPMEMIASAPMNISQEYFHRIPLKVWVGKMPDDIEDTFVRSLLEKCDRVLDWDRYINESTFATKGFGFCTFEKIEGVWRCMRLLNGVEIDDTHKIEVKPVSEVNNLLNQYKEQIKDQLQHKGVVVSEDSDLLSEETKKEDERLKMFIEEEINKRRSIVHKVSSDNNNYNYNNRNEDGELSNNKNNNNNNNRRRSRPRSRSRSRSRGSRSNRRSRDSRSRSYHRHSHHHSHHSHRRNNSNSRSRRRDSINTVSNNNNNITTTTTTTTINNNNNNNNNKRKSNEEKRNNSNNSNSNKKSNQQQIQPPLPQPPLPVQPPTPDQNYDRNKKVEIKIELPLLNTQNKETEKLKSVIVNDDEDDSDDINNKGINKEKKSTQNFIEIKYTEEEIKEAEKWSKKMEKCAMEEKAKRLKSLIDNLPTDIEGLLKYKINWEVVDKENIIKNKIQNWLVEKLNEVFGMCDEDILKFILLKLTNHDDGSALLEELKIMMDEEESEMFVIKLWRKLIFEMHSSE